MSTLPTDSQLTFDDPVTRTQGESFPDEDEFTFAEPDLDDELELEAELEREALAAMGEYPEEMEAEAAELAPDVRAVGESLRGGDAAAVPIPPGQDAMPPAKETESAGLSDGKAAPPPPADPEMEDEWEEPFEEEREIIGRFVVPLDDGAGERELRMRAPRPSKRAAVEGSAGVGVSLLDRPIGALRDAIDRKTAASLAARAC